METCKEGLVFERLLHERIDILLEGQINTNTHRTVARAGAGGTLVGRLHEARTAACDDITAHLREHGGHAFHFIVSESSWPGPRRAKNGNAVGVVFGRPQAREIID